MLSILPANWPLDSLKAFLSNTLRKDVHEKRVTAVNKSLAKFVASRYSATFQRFTGEKLVLSEDKYVYGSIVSYFSANGVILGGAKSAGSDFLTVLLSALHLAKFVIILLVNLGKYVRLKN